MISFKQTAKSKLWSVSVEKGDQFITYEEFRKNIDSKTEGDFVVTSTELFLLFYSLCQVQVSGGSPMQLRGFLTCH